MVDSWSKGQIISFLNFVGDTPFTNNLSKVMMYLLIVGIDDKTRFVDSTQLRKLKLSMQNTNQIPGMLQSCACCGFLPLNFLTY